MHPLFGGFTVHNITMVIEYSYKNITFDGLMSRCAMGGLTLCVCMNIAAERIAI